MKKISKQDKRTEHRNSIEYLLEVGRAVGLLEQIGGVCDKRDPDNPHISSLVRFKKYGLSIHFINYDDESAIIYHSDRHNMQVLKRIYPKGNKNKWWLRLYKETKILLSLPI